MFNGPPPRVHSLSLDKIELTRKQRIMVAFQICAPRSLRVIRVAKGQSVKTTYI